MKKALTLLGIAALLACILCLAYGILNLFAYYHTLDGSSALYHRLHNRMTVSFIIGAVLAAIGVVCLLIRSRS